MFSGTVRWLEDVDPRFNGQCPSGSSMEPLILALTDTGDNEVRNEILT